MKAPGKVAHRYANQRLEIGLTTSFKAFDLLMAKDVDMAPPTDFSRSCLALVGHNPVDQPSVDFCKHKKPKYILDLPIVASHGSRGRRRSLLG